MGRNYWVRAPTLAPDESPLDAWTTRTRMMGNLEAAYEEARNDQCIILPASVDASPVTLPLVGPFPIIQRMDRGGSWRDLYVALLCCGGTGTPTLRVVVTDRYRRPRAALGAGFVWAGVADTTEPYVDFAPGSGSTVAWQDAAALTLPAWWSPATWDQPGGFDEVGRTFLAWGSIWITTTPAVTYGQISGVRIYESVTLET